MHFRTWYCWLLVVLAGAGLIAAEFWLRHARPDPSPVGPEVLWTFETPQAGSIISSPWVDGERIYVGVIRDAGLSPQGAVYALDRTTGKAVWSFDDEGEMQHMYSSPRVWGNRLFIGEGMHANVKCKLYCLDERNGTKEWSFPVDGHIESTPVIADGKVIFGAGDDGLWAVDSARGNRIWRYGQEIHVDSTVAVSGQRVFAGSGVSRRFNNPGVFCVGLADGHEIWNVPTDLPAWGSPLVTGGRLYIGLGHGRLDRSLESPAGAVLCLNAETGQRLWRRELPDAVMTQPVPAGDWIVVNCRDGACYALSRDDGRIVWKRPLGSALVTNPVLKDGRLYVVASDGIVAALDPESGAEVWRFNVAEHARAKVLLFSSPAVVTEADGGHVLYFGAELETPGGRVANLYALRE